MFESPYFEPWVGSQYGNESPRLLNVGESRYDEEFTDRKIIQERLNGNRSRTITNFVQAILGTRHWEPGYDETGFWNRVLFYNYNTTFSPVERDYRCHGTNG
jgi:hypothetical protein